MLLDVLSQVDFRSNIIPQFPLLLHHDDFYRWASLQDVFLVTDCFLWGQRTFANYYSYFRSACSTHLVHSLIYFYNVSQSFQLYDPSVLWCSWVQWRPTSVITSRSHSGACLSLPCAILGGCFLLYSPSKTRVEEDIESDQNSQRRRIQ